MNKNQNHDKPNTLSSVDTNRIDWFSRLEQIKTTAIASVAVVSISVYLILFYGFGVSETIARMPLLITLILGGIPLVLDLLLKVFRLNFGADLLGGISIITSVLLGEYLAGAIIVLMLSGGEALESYALSNASSVLAALAKRMPSVAHRQQQDQIIDVPLADIAIDDILILYPHDICPVDGVVVDGHGDMDESYLTGEPFQMTKTIGSSVISGAVNGDTVLRICAKQLAADSRYAKIMKVMQESEQSRPTMRRLGDQLGAIYTPVALVIAMLAWWLSGESTRFLSVLVIATPCPLLLAIPIAIIGSISLCARRSIIVKSPIALEQVVQCRTAIFDKTGTLTYGEPTLSEQLVAPNQDRRSVLAMVASIERYSKHPLAHAILDAAEREGIALAGATAVSEQPGAGLVGTVGNHQIRITSRNKLVDDKVPGYEDLPDVTAGLECVVVIDGHYAATLRMRDAPRRESKDFVTHLTGKHRFDRVMIVSGDRESEVRYLANLVGVTEVLAEQSPEQKLDIVRRATAKSKSMYVGDGINDAPAMMAATVGIAIGQNSDVTAEAADVVVMDNSLNKVDEFIHISRRMRTIALQSALGGMALSIIGMGLASFGYLNPVSGAISQEVIDVIAVVNAVRAAWPPRTLTDVHSPTS